MPNASLTRSGRPSSRLVRGLLWAGLVLLAGPPQAGVHASPKQVLPAAAAPRVSDPLAFRPSAPTYGYECLAVYPHDVDAFTEGLIVVGDNFYEGTGLYGRSSLRKVEIATGAILKQHDLPETYFGEGVTALRDTLYQITWMDHTGLSYVERDTFELVESFPYAWEGWGLTHDGTHLIASDGSSTIRFLDSRTRELVSSIQVHDGSTPITLLNELEYIQGKIYSNVWFSDQIAVIDPADGSVEAWLNLAGLRDSLAAYPNAEVLNGIAFDPETTRLFVTGKFWPKVFEIDVPTLHPNAVDDEPPVSLKPSIAGAIPNPVRGTTRLIIALPREAPVSLRLYDVRGRLLRTLLDDDRPAGEQVLDLDLTGIPSGSYFVKLVSGGMTDSRKILIVK